MLKIGLFTFGGGYAMIPFLEQEFVDKRQWLTHDEFVSMVALAESTPGPLAINAATFIGYRVGRVLGAILCTLGVSLPSFAVIYVISLFFDQFLAIGWVAAAFRGIQIGVTFLIAMAAINFFRKLPKTAFNLTVFGVTLSCSLAFALFSVNFSAIFYILISAALGLTVYLIGYLSKRNKRASDPVTTGEEQSAAATEQTDTQDAVLPVTDTDATPALSSQDPSQQGTKEDGQ